MFFLRIYLIYLSLSVFSKKNSSIKKMVAVFRVFIKSVHSYAWYSKKHMVQVFKTISCQWYLFIPPENIRKPLFFSCFQRCKKGAVACMGWCYPLIIQKSYNPFNIYLFKVNIRNTRKRYEICSKLTVKTLERRQWRGSGVFIVNFEHISNLFLVFLILAVNKY